MYPILVDLIISFYYIQPLLALANDDIKKPQT